MMKCEFCGAPNADDAKFCQSCGEKLPLPMPVEHEEFDTTQRNFEPAAPIGYIPPSQEKPKSKLPVIGGIVLLLFVLVGSYFFISQRGVKEVEKRAMDYESEGKYSLAKLEYVKLYDKTDKEKYREKRDLMTEYEKYDQLIQEAENFVRGGNYRGAISSYLKIPNSGGPQYKKAQDRIQGIVESIQTELNGYMDRNDFETARKSAEDYERLLPGNQTIQNIKKRAEEGQRQAEETRLALKEQELEAEKQKAQAAQAAAAAEKKKAQKTYNESRSLIGSWQVVRAGQANVRSGPGKGYSVLYILHRGDSVYVYDTYNDSVRTWCDIGDGWISYRTLNGEIK